MSDLPPVPEDGLDDAPVEPSRRRFGRRKGSSSGATPPRKKHRLAKWLLIGFSALIVLGLALGGVGYFYVNYRYNQIPKVHNVKGLKPEQPGKPVNILLIGSDSRSGIPPDEAVHYGGNTGVNAVTGQRSDVIIILRLIPATHGLEMLSIPRDTYVNIPGLGQDRVNASFNYGPSLLIKTIEDDFHIPINHFVYTTFPGFTNGVNALGGIYMKFSNPVRDDVTGLHIHHTGCQLLNGANALALVRSRDLSYEANGVWNYDGLGDLSRIRRQEAFFHAVIHRVETIWNPLTLNAFIGDMVHDITIDAQFSLSEMTQLIQEYHSIPSSALHTEVLPTMGATTAGGAEVLLPAWRYDDLMIRNFLADGATKSKGTSPAGHGPTTTTQPPDVTGTTTPIIFDNPKNYPEPWNPVPC
jgi:LCP family protein required for cell wall assembly